ncbi:PEPxxWA-CTERM sorting domain-containing protein [Thermaurantiacus sp.]
MGLRSLAFTAAALMASPLLAQGVITSGPYSVGIGPHGELFDAVSFIGFVRNSDGYDPLAPGTPRDSWGISTAAGTAYGDYQVFGALNIASVVFTQAWGGATQTALISTNFGVGIRMDYSFAAPNVVKILHTVYSLGGDVGGGPVGDFLFQRDWDLDIPPTPFFENTVGAFLPLPVVDDSYDGFENPDPSAAYLDSCGSACNVVGDLGGGIKISSLVYGNRFTYCYAISQEGQSMVGLVGQMASLGCRHIIATQGMDAGQFPNLGELSGAISLTGAIPEPSTWAMLIAGFGLVGWAARQRKAAVSA